MSLNHLPAPLHIAGLRLAHALRRRWWRLARLLGRAPVRGCRVLVLDREERVLLIRHSYGERHWTLPGGIQVTTTPEPLPGVRPQPTPAPAPIAG